MSADGYEAGDRCDEEGSFVVKNIQGNAIDLGEIMIY